MSQLVWRTSLSPLQLAWHPSSELLSISSHSKKEAFRLVHAPSFSVFSNWPTASTPLHSVSSVAFSSNGMQRRARLLAHVLSPAHAVILTVSHRKIRSDGQRQGAGASLQIEALQHVTPRRVRKHGRRRCHQRPRAFLPSHPIHPGGTSKRMRGVVQAPLCKHTFFFDPCADVGHRQKVAGEIKKHGLQERA